MDQGEVSTILISLLGIITGVYFLFQGNINDYLVGQNLGYLGTFIASIMIVIFNYARPRVNSMVQEMMDGMKGDKGE